MQKRNRITHFLMASLVIVCVFCIGIFSFLAIYTTGNNEKTINHVGSIYMANMNDRISKHFSTMVDLRLSQLDTLVETAPINRSKDSNELREWLEYNAAIRGFESLSYYFDDGSFEIIYGQQVEPVDSDLFMQFMKNGERKISMGINSEDEGAAVIGVPFKMEMADGRVCIALVGEMPFDYISETLSLDEENSLMYSYVIRKDGTFIVRSANATRDNYFDRVRAFYDEVVGMDVEEFITELQQAMANNQDFSAMFKMNGD